MDKNEAKQQVILKLTEQLTRELPDSVTEADSIMTETLYKQQEKIEHLKVLWEEFTTRLKLYNQYNIVAFWLYSLSQLHTYCFANDMLVRCICM